MNILIFNCGSSSLSYKIFNVKNFDEIEIVITGKAHRVGVIGTEPSFLEHKYKGEVQKNVVAIKDYKQAADLILKFINENNIKIDYIGNRFVHGGNYFNKSVFINEETLKKLKLCLPLAPLHNPTSLNVISKVKKSFPDINQYVVFDSAFHSTLPYYAYTYALPKFIIEKFNFRKYGFHGLSYFYVTKTVSDFLNIPLQKLKLIACHLGTGGSSVAAIKNGSSVDTSMGFSPLTGLVMSTRSGDIDPMIMIYLMNVYGYRPDELMNILNKKSGLLGISGISSDIRDIISRITEKDQDQSDLAFKMYIHRLKKYIGSYIVAALEGIDVLIFTDDIGIQNALVREKVCENMEWCGILLDKEKNNNYKPNKIGELNVKNSKVKILAVPTDEERVMVWEGIKLIKEKKDADF